MKDETTPPAPRRPSQNAESYKNEPEGLAMRTYPGGVHWTRSPDGSYEASWGALGMSGKGPTHAGAIARRITARAGNDRERVTERLKELDWWDVLAHLLAVEPDQQEAVRRALGTPAEPEGGDERFPTAYRKEQR